MRDGNRWVLVFVLVSTSVLVLSGCSLLPSSAPQVPLLPTSTPLPPGMLVYDAPITLVVKTGTILPGTTIAYGGKMPTDQAKVIIAGQLAPKKVADTLDWQGSPVPNVFVKLNTRVLTFDDNSVTLGGTSHIELTNVNIQPGGTPGTAQLEFNAPVTFSLSKGQTIPGTKLSYVGASDAGAQFSGIEGYPYRKQLDSLQYMARVAPKVYLRFDLRVVNFSDASAIVGGTTNIRIEQ